jgi:hypothetical protein
LYFRFFNYFGSSLIDFKDEFFVPFSACFATKRYSKLNINNPDCVKASLLWSHFILIGANQNKNIIVIFAA